MTEDTEREKKLKAAMDYIEKAFGKGSIMKLGEKGPHVSVDVIPSGSIRLDAAMGIGGFPRGRVTEIYGQEASGKTTLALHAIAEAQRDGGKAAFLDVEHALDPNYARALGVNVEELLISQPDYGEQALEIAEILVRSGAVELIVVDSVAALVPKAELEGDMGDSHMGLMARLMSQALRKLAGIVNKSNTALMFINQVREKIGVVFGNPETTTGGKALKFYSSLRVEVKKQASIKQGDTVIGNYVRAKIVKNKLAPPFRETTLELIYGKGIDRLGDILDAAVSVGLIEKAGSWYSYKNERIGQGRDNIKKLLGSKPELLEEIELETRKRLGLISEAQSS